MRSIQKKEVLAKLLLMKSTGNHVNEHLFKAVDSSNALFLISLEDKATFLSLIWQTINQSRLLTPNYESRILYDVTKRMLENSWTFKKLSANLGLPKNQHNPEWFRTCFEIDKKFDFERFGWITIVPAKNCEQTESPKGSFYIYDGVHKSLVLSKRLLRNETEFQPIEALYILPRPEK